jgi:iron-sulfur cluster repair protein YtfE (RIC family)
MLGPINHFLAEDHRRLEDLRARASAGPGGLDLNAYGEFRAGLLRHIGMEESILIPAAQRARGGEPVPVAAKLRLDHAALAALLCASAVARNHRRDPGDLICSQSA